MTGFDPIASADMAMAISKYTDEGIERELVFAEGFDDKMPAAVEWLRLLREEAATRGMNQR